jgi:hypothetical protein
MFTSAVWIERNIKGDVWRTIPAQNAFGNFCDNRRSDAVVLRTFVILDTPSVTYALSCLDLVPPLEVACCPSAFYDSYGVQLNFTEIWRVHGAHL